jgi:hypothetical protein
LAISGFVVGHLGGVFGAVGAFATVHFHFGGGRRGGLGEAGAGGGEGQGREQHQGLFHNI